MSSPPPPTPLPVETATPSASKQAPMSAGTTSASGPTTSSTEPTKSSGGGQASYIPKEVKGAKAFLPATAQTSSSGDASQPAPVPTSQSSGSKAVRGWAPPTKEWDEDTGKKKTDQTRFEIKEEWDEDGNLVRTTIKKTISPDWKTKIEKTIDIIPAAEAAKLKKK